MTMIDGRHERHMMRQRGAGARSIPTNFGFIFQAGPVQLSATTPTESPLPTNAPLPTTLYSEAQQPPEKPQPSEKPVPKRKRVVRDEEDEDQVWFSKRAKKTTPNQQDEPHFSSTAPEEVTLAETHAQPQSSIETKTTKRKTVRKRVLVPKSRRKAPVESESQPQHDQPTVTVETVVEGVSIPNKKTKTNAVATRKQKSKDSAAPAVSLQDDELSKDSLQDISTSKPAPFKKARPNEDDHQETTEPKKRTRAVLRKRVGRKDIQKDLGNEQVSPKEEDTKMMKPSPPLKKEEVEEQPKTKATRKRKVVKKHVEDPVEGEAIPNNQATIANSTEDQPLALAKVEEPVDEPVQAEKKRKVVKRVRVPRIVKAQPIPEEDTRPANAAAQDALKTTCPRWRSPLEEGTSNSSPKKSDTSLNAESLPDKKSNTRERKTNQLKAMTAKTKEAAPLQPTQTKSLHHSKPIVAATEDADMALFKAEAPVLVTKKATKAPKRVFNDDDSEIDLDQMLSGIAAMAGTGAAKPSATKSTRLVKRKEAAS